VESSGTYREFLKATAWELWDGLETDQRRGLPPPAPHKPCPESATRVDLVPPQELTVGQMPLVEAIRRRRSRRKFTPEPLTLEQLSFLLWATQGVSGAPGEGGERLLDDVAAHRTVPSGGGRHPFETYLLLRRVEGLAPGLYRYLPLAHQLCGLRPLEQGPEERVEGAWGWRRSLRESAVIFIWTTVPYRTEWRYGVISPKIIALEAGHVCQNLYLACEAIGCGTCANVEYDQKLLDALVDVDGEAEFVVYLAPVGRVG
jgi:SagB-type dehydrogenase family enzyme